MRKSYLRDSRDTRTCRKGKHRPADGDRVIGLVLAFSRTEEPTVVTEAVPFGVRRHNWRISCAMHITSAPGRGWSGNSSSP